MYELSERELYEAIHYAKSLDEATGARFIEQFQLEQTAMAQTLFGLFPGVIAEQSQDMSYLFMDLCFDVLCVSTRFRSIALKAEMDFNGLEKQAVLLDAELQSLVTERPMDEKIRSKLQDRFVKRSEQETAQRGLVSFMNAAIDELASENPSTVPATKSPR